MKMKCRPLTRANNDGNDDQLELTPETMKQRPAPTA